MESAQADTTPPYEFSFRSGVEQDSDGNWMTVNSVGPVFTEYTDDDGAVQTVDAQTTAYRARVDADAAEVQRSTRTTLLAESDWTQMADTALSTEKKAEWVTYRQALRDLPMRLVGLILTPCQRSLHNAQRHNTRSSTYYARH